ncbi:hypothetical protein ABW19_dt0200542 [Dactylella cylindrospora]|nr:hypothetical protein ABW19_dt0200542 [Dactylella cylindrospora]
MFRDLPLELHEIILSYFSPSEQIILSEVCTLWKLLLSEKRYLSKRYTPDESEVSAKRPHILLSGGGDLTFEILNGKVRDIYFKARDTGSQNSKITDSPILGEKIFLESPDENEAKYGYIRGRYSRSNRYGTVYAKYRSAIGYQVKPLYKNMGKKAELMSVGDLVHYIAEELYDTGRARAIRVLYLAGFRLVGNEELDVYWDRVKDKEAKEKRLDAERGPLPNYEASHLSRRFSVPTRPSRLLDEFLDYSSW